jgi:PKD repeat protein
MKRIALFVLLVGIAGLAAGCTLFQSGPVARFEVSPAVIYAGDRVTLDASSSSGQSIVSYDWTVDGEPLAGEQVNYTFSAAGQYTVDLVVQDADGHSARVEQEITVYLPSGTQLFADDFSDGAAALDRWHLDPTWASAGDGTIVQLDNAHGDVLHIASNSDRWYRLTMPVTLPPLRTGQRVVYTIQAMMAQTQDGYSMKIQPARRSLDDLSGTLPYYLYTSQIGAAVEEPEDDAAIAHPISFVPKVYAWDTYRFAFTATRYTLSIDGEVYASGQLPQSIAAGGAWMILLGDESHTTACNAYFDNIQVKIEE